MGGSRNTTVYQPAPPPPTPPPPPPDQTAHEPLQRVPRNVLTGNLVGTAASRSLSSSFYRRTAPTDLLRPLLAGY